MADHDNEISDFPVHWILVVDCVANLFVPESFGNSSNFILGLRKGSVIVIYSDKKMFF
ncbi:hypothetical protein AMATHDRAFT_8633 [Amanita thiersii Skay4041]|uniref:Uncharacterized protein n=1 Tax=Amanita thiersii Skay4041 TaxID=703135 RepID=A0A2A9N993_9AGAR|nr:hypothetical protein AMATHDRAFT_8633 [Amanita thiersii Skay4041]